MTLDPKTPSGEQPKDDLQSQDGAIAGYAAELHSSEEAADAAESLRLSNLLSGENPIDATAAPASSVAQASAEVADAEPEAPHAEEATQAPFPKSRRTPVLHPILQPWSHPVTKLELERPHENITLPTVAAERMDEITNDLRNIDLVDSESIGRWTESFERAAMYYPRLQRCAAAVNREGSKFVQTVPSAAGELGIRSPKIISDADDVMLSGAKAVNYIRASFGLGTVKQIPLWGSGFWVSLKAPSDADLLELYRRMSESKISLGRATAGLVFSNTRAFTTAMLVDFAIEHIFDHTINEPKPDLAALIVSSDIPTLIAGLAAIVHPNGFHYTTQCMAKPEECHEVIQQKADAAKMVFTDYSRLSEAQIKHMSRSRGRTMSAVSIKDYQATFANGGERMVDLGCGVKMFLKLPNCQEYESIGADWINSIVTMVNTALGLEVTDGVRNAYVAKQSNATTLRQYQHYVSHFEAGMASVKTQEGIATILNDLSASEDQRKVIFEAVGTYIDDNTISVVATTDFVCPACGKSQTDHSVADPKITRSCELIPVHPEQVFFTLLAQKDQLVALR